MGSWRGHLAALGGVAVVVLIGLVGVREATTEVGTEQLQGGSTAGELVDGATVGQTFTAEHAGLDSVAVRPGTYARENRGTVVFALRGPGLGEGITRTVEAAELEDNTYEAFEFPPIRDSAGQGFTFTLEAPGAAAGNAVTVWGTREDVYPDGEAVLRGLYGGERVRDLAFRLTYDPPLRDRVDLFGEQLAAGKPSVWGDRRLYVILGGSYLALLYALFVTTTGRGGGDEEA